MNKFLLICAAILGLGVLAQAQPTLPPEVQRGLTEPAPVIDAEAQRFVEQMVARYAALRSYSDVTELRIENAAGEPVIGDGWGFRATLQWERPTNIRFEGKSNKGAFLALGTSDIMRVVSPNYPAYYIAQPRSSPLILTHADGTKTEMANPEPIRLEEPLMGYGISGFPGEGFMLDSKFWKRVLSDVRELNFDPDAEAEGEPCRVARIRFLADDGTTSLSRVFVAKSDGLIRRYESRYDNMPADTFIVETHSDVKANAELPAASWDFKVPTDAKPIDYFSRLDEGKYEPDLKVGDLLPTFSADSLNGRPVELNAESGKVTVVYFLNMAMSVWDAQILRKIQQIVGPDKLQVIGVSGDGVRPRVEKWVEATKLDYPIYFDESGMKNPLAQKFGVKAWTSVFVFGPDGKLKFIDNGIMGVEFQKNLRTLLPQIGPNDFVLQDDEFFKAP